jgi:hypothetical protein
MASRDAQKLAGILDSLVSQANAGCAIEAPAATALEETLNGCTTVLEHIDVEVRPFVKMSADGEGGKWKSFAWSFKGERVANLREQLKQHMTNVSLAISTSNL